MKRLNRPPSREPVTAGRACLWLSQLVIMILQQLDVGARLRNGCPGAAGGSSQTSPQRSHHNCSKHTQQKASDPYPCNHACILRPMLACRGRRQKRGRGGSAVDVCQSAEVKRRAFGPAILARSDAIGRGEAKGREEHRVQEQQPVAGVLEMDGCIHAVDGDVHACGRKGGGAGAALSAHKGAEHCKGNIT
eukprot:TRINITY_DN12415_c2_g1_i3.p1 TRINITY_DN12415_c2_g1~~TRINITY_DN12415_c2_g1_i3.p1  ORF type:complete len:191 (-),score=10.17 TRINITY_DN12415_c2_g1_i3:115-687(-)